MARIDKRIEELLEKRGVVGKKEVDAFLNPSFSFLKDPFLLSGMKEAVARIKIAIEQKQKVVIYGDYDTDGISASAMMYLFLKSQNLIVDVFIPNRFEDGYGLSSETIKIIEEQCKPNLLITVDCGITAKTEVERLTSLGIDTIVTDHHEPPEQLPNCIIVDPKLKNQTYGFDGLCGAGVVFKLIQALGGDYEKYVDLCAVATIGDIVPLVSENRIIAWNGLRILNERPNNLGLALMKNRYFKDTISAQDISFKIVPRLNSTGRMSDSLIAFKLLVEDDEIEAEKLIDQIEEINTKRLETITNSIAEIESKLTAMDTNEKPALFFYSENFHQGVLGIIASKLVSEFGRPAFIFTKTDDGMIKGSCRSIEGLDIHSILSNSKRLCNDIGGHKMAAGLSLPPENLQELEQEIQKSTKEALKNSIKKYQSYDIEIFENDISLGFAKQLEMLEPTGSSNERPVLKLTIKDCIFKMTNNPKHFQIVLPERKYLMCFSGSKYQTYFENKEAKNIYLNLSLESYNGIKKPRAIVNYVEQQNIEKSNENYFAQCLYQFNRFSSVHAFTKLSESELISKTDNLDKFGNLFISQKFETCEKYQSIIQNHSTEIPASTESTLCYLPREFFGYEYAKRYKNIFLLDGIILDSQCGCYPERTELYIIKNSEKINVNCDKELFKQIYKTIRKHAKSTIGKNWGSYINFLNSISKESYQKNEIVLAFFVFCELGFIDINTNDGFYVSINESTKKELSMSKLYNLFS